MASTPLDRTVEWEGGSLAELVAALQASALPVRIEVMVPGTMGSNAGEVHLIAGGMADAFAGSLRRDDAMAALQRLEGARFVVEVRLPDPESGSLSEAGPAKGSLKDRPLAALMRYCEDYVLTCRVEISRGQERGVVSYRRGELVGTTVDGRDGDELLPGMLGWSDGVYEIVLPPPPLPPSPTRKREGQLPARPGDDAAKPERKRRETLPIVPGAGARAAGTPPPPVPAVGLATTTPDLTRPFEPAKAAALLAQTPVVPPRPAPPPPSAIPSPSSLRLSAPPQPPPAASQPATPGGPGIVPQTAFPPEHTKRGIPVVPAASQPAASPRPAGAPAAKPAAQPAPTASPKLKPAVAPSAMPASLKSAAPPVTAKPVAATLKPGAPATAVAKPATLTARPAPVAAVVPATPPKLPAAKAPPPVAAAKPATLASHPAPAAAKPATPPPLKPGTLPSHPAVSAPPAATAASATASAKPANKPAPPSNDLKPASGTIEAKPAHGALARPQAVPIEVAEEPAARPPTPLPQQAQPSVPRRRRTTARRKVPERPVRVYLLTGLAIGIGIVLAYWLYWSMHLGQR